jgi:hypothetical protein
MEALTFGVHTATVEGEDALIVVTRLLKEPSVKAGISKKSGKPYRIETYNEDIYNGDVEIDGRPLKLSCQLIAPKGASLEVTDTR